MTRDAAAAAAMSSAASALARFSKSLEKKRKDLTWVTSLLQSTLAAPGGGATESEPEGEEEDEDEAKAPDRGRADKAEPGEPTEAQLAARQAVAEARAEAAESDLAAQEQEDARAEGAGQTVHCTLLKGWAVAARRLAQIAALRGTARKQHQERTTSYIKVEGNPDPRKVPSVIPATFAAFAQAAAKDNNKLQSKINVHEHALDWIRIFEGSAQNKLTQRRLEDLLLPGTNAVFAAIPSSPAMRVKADRLAFRIRMQFGMKAKLGGFYEVDAYELALMMGQREKNLRHDAVTDALLDVSVASNLVACREPEKHFHCHNGTGLSVCPDGVIILEDGTVIRHRRRVRGVGGGSTGADPGEEVGAGRAAGQGGSAGGAGGGARPRGGGGARGAHDGARGAGRALQNRAQERELVPQRLREAAGARRSRVPVRLPVLLRRLAVAAGGVHGARGTHGG
jgi:hypothetical protein